MRDKIAIVIVLYNNTPKDYIFSNKDLNIVIVDNTPNQNLTLKGDNLYYMPLSNNYGIAKALNVGFQKAIELGMDWVLTMDQDSELPEDMIDEYIGFINSKHYRIGIVSPLINMYRGDHKKPSNTFVEINEALTSGSFINIQAYKDSGGFKNELFIDSVDFEFCWNIKRKGYKIYQLNKIIMQHQLGETREFRFLGKHLFYVTNHNYVRRYYITRNSLFVRNLYGDMMPKIKYKKIRRLISYLKIILFETDVLRKLKAIRLGTKDFKNNKFGKFDY